MRAYIQLIGPIWWPYGATAAAMHELSGYDIENIRAYGDGTIDREAVELWANAHVGDFQEIQDFTVWIPSENIDIPWANEDSEIEYNGAMSGDDE